MTFQTVSFEGAELAVELLLEHDLPDGRVRLSGTALLSDAEDIIFGDHAWELLTFPVRFLHAEWSTGAVSASGYPLAAVDAFRHKTVAVRFVEGVEQAGSIMTQTGAVATELLSEAPRRSPIGGAAFCPQHISTDNDVVVVSRRDRQHQAAAEDLLDAAIALGGTVTGEHGVGLLKKGGMERELDPSSLLMQRAVKHALDPLGLFNPGKVLSC